MNWPALQLDKVLPETNFDNTTFADAINYFIDVTGANIVPNYKAMEAAGVDRATPITLKLHNAKASTALSKVLKIVGGQTKISYEIDKDGFVNVSTAEDLSSTPVYKVYDIRDLLVDIPNFSIQDVTSASSQLTSGGGGRSNGRRHHGRRRRAGSSSSTSLSQSWFPAPPSCSPLQPAVDGRNERDHRSHRGRPQLERQRRHHRLSL